MRREGDLPSAGLCAALSSGVRFMLTEYLELTSLVCGETPDLHSELFKIVVFITASLDTFLSFMLYINSSYTDN